MHLQRGSTIILAITSFNLTYFVLMKFGRFLYLGIWYLLTKFETFIPKIPLFNYHNNQLYHFGHFIRFIVIHLDRSTLEMDF